MTSIRSFVLTLSIALPLSLSAQLPSTQFVDVGSEREKILRTLQLIGDVPLYPWSIRQFSPRELDRLTPNTRQGLATLPSESSQHVLGPLRIEVLPVEAGVVYNSRFPYGFNDGPLWAGRGLTASFSGGASGRIGPVSFQFEPQWFDAQNQTFPLKVNPSATSAYADGFYPTRIDAPQRFGDNAYGRFDIGQSSIRLDVGPFAAELSNANQWWGPALQSPIILGNNAPGFVHAMFGSSHPIPIGVGKIHARVVYGRLEQSAYSPAAGADTARFMSGVVGVFMPRGAPGLEIGIARFFHTRWPIDGLRHAPFSRPFEGILKHSLATNENPSGDDPDNQLASVFFRWTFPGSAAGLEVYGEYGREDHNADTRDLLQEPDHDAAFSLGIQRVWRRSGGQVVVRGELLSTRLSRLQQGRDQSPWYIYTGGLSQGHTQDGQLLGAAGGYGGGAATLAVDFHSTTKDGPSRWTFEWNRIMRGELRAPDKYPIARGADVMHALLVQRVITRGKLALLVSGGPVWDLNRDLEHDQVSFTARVGIRSAF